MLAVVIGVVIGLVLGLTGAGGSVFAVPLLVLFIGLPIQQAAGLSLGAVFVAACVGVILRLRSKTIQWLPALVLVVFGVLAAPIGTTLAQYSSESFIVLSFCILVCIIALRLWKQASQTPEIAREVRATTAKGQPMADAMCGPDALSFKNFRLACFVRLMLAGLVTGVLSGFYGVGGGFVIVPALVTLLRLHIKQAIGTSLVVIAFVSASGFISFLRFSQLDSEIFQSIALGGIVGMVAGLILSRLLAGPALQRFFAGMMLVMAAVMLWARLF